jgi:hypothetical protein
MFRASMCPSSGENCCIYAALVFVTLYGWCLVCWLDSIQPADQTPPIQSDKYQCRKDTSIFLLMMGTWLPETCRVNRTVHLVGFIYEIIQGCRSKKHKNILKNGSKWLASRSGQFNLEQGPAAPIE